MSSSALLNDLSDILASLNFKNIDDIDDESLMRINSILNGALNLQQIDNMKTSFVDSVWSDLVNNSDNEIIHKKSIQDYYEGNKNTDMVSRPSYGSSNSGLRFGYSTSSGSSDRGNRMSSSGDPGTPTLDDVLLMGSNVSFGPETSNKINDRSVSYLMNTLSLNSSSYETSESSQSSGNSYGISPPYFQHSPKNYSMGQVGASHYQGLDLPNLSSSLENAWLSSSLLDGPPVNKSAPYPSVLQGSGDPYSIEKAAKMHRSAAAMCEATCTWSGELPIRVYNSCDYSCKVFLGGVPWDVTEETLRHAFQEFGNIQVDWPCKENSLNSPRGYVYILFEHEKQVKALLSACNQDFSSPANYYFKISSSRMRQKEVQVIPWSLSDSNFVRSPSHQLDLAKTVFIGALHGMLTAEGLAKIMNDLYGGVIYCGIDTDKHRYPIGSGRITFNNAQSYKNAVRSAFVEIKTTKFMKKVQIDPYLAESMCQHCDSQPGPYFCRDESCFGYFCRPCWLVTHISFSGDMLTHKPLMRNSKLRNQTNLSRVI